MNLPQSSTDYLFVAECSIINFTLMAINTFFYVVVTVIVAADVVVIKVKSF